jgi:hypothetical protein
MPDSIPGFEAIRETEEVQIWGSGPDNQHQRYEAKIHIKSTVVDSGNTPTTTLRGGFLLGRKGSDGLDYKYDPFASDGTQLPIGVLEHHTTMLDRYGTAQDKVKNIMRGGLIQNIADLINSDAQALQVLLRTGFHLMDPVPDGALFLVRYRKRQIKAADYTILAADNGDLFVSITGAVIYTLPTKAIGLSFEFFQTTNNDMTVISAGSADDIMVKNDLGADSVAFSTTSEKIGSHARFSCIAIDTSGTLRWIVENLGDTTMTIT